MAAHAVRDGRLETFDIRRISVNAGSTGSRPEQHLKYVRRASHTTNMNQPRTRSRCRASHEPVRTTHKPAQYQQGTRRTQRRTRSEPQGDAEHSGSELGAHSNSDEPAAKPPQMLASHEPTANHKRNNCAQAMSPTCTRSESSRMRSKAEASQEHTANPMNQPSDQPEPAKNQRQATSQPRTTHEPPRIQR